LSDARPWGRSANLFLFDPPLAALPPDNCTTLAEVIVPLKGQVEHGATLRGESTSIPPPGLSSGVRDRDSLRLICVRP
jgi:hypothetical protein